MSGVVTGYGLFNVTPIWGCLVHRKEVTPPKRFSSNLSPMIMRSTWDNIHSVQCSVGTRPVVRKCSPDNDCQNQHPDNTFPTSLIDTLDPPWYKTLIVINVGLFEDTHKVQTTRSSWSVTPYFPPPYAISPLEKQTLSPESPPRREVFTWNKWSIFSFHVPDGTWWL